MQTRRVLAKQGDCISSLAYEHGLFWRTVWEHPDNSELKRTRKIPFQLLPGDCVIIPPLRTRQEACASEQRHRFLKKGVPAIVKIKILERAQEPPPEESEGPPEDEGSEGAELVVEEAGEESQPEQPARNKPYQVIIDGAVGPAGRTDQEGMLKLALPPNARQAQLIIEGGTPRERTIRVQLGCLDPIRSRSGQAQRLANLGFGADATGKNEARLAQALAEFQRSLGMDPTGQADASTLGQLEQAHGG